MFKGLFRPSTTREQKRAITEAIKSLSEDICASADIERNKQRAEAINVLRRAYYGQN